MNILRLYLTCFSGSLLPSSACHMVVCDWSSVKEAWLTCLVWQASCTLCCRVASSRMLLQVAQRACTPPLLFLPCSAPAGSLNSKAIFDFSLVTSSFFSTVVSFSHCIASCTSLPASRNPGYLLLNIFTRHIHSKLLIVAVQFVFSSLACVGSCNCITTDWTLDGAIGFRCNLIIWLNLFWYLKIRKFVKRFYRNVGDVLCICC